MCVFLCVHACVFNGCLSVKWFNQMKLCLVNNAEPQASHWISLGTNRRTFYQHANQAPCVTGFLRLGSTAPTVPSTNIQMGTKGVGTVPSLVVLKDFFEGDGWYAGQFLANMLTLQSPLVNGPFPPNCSIVLVGQAGGPKPHLASGEKRKKRNHIYIVYGSVGGGWQH